MSNCARVVVMECCYLQPDMDLSVYFPSIMAYIIALSLDEILESVVPYTATRYLFGFVLLVTLNNCQWWRKVMSIACNRVKEC
jgi:hypothetical protein